jgi:hypothetical protein
VSKVSKVSSFKQIVCAVYAAGAQLVVGHDGRLCIDGDVSPDLKREIRRHKNELLEMLTGDPTDGPGHEGRNALFDQAVKWMDREIKRRGLDHARAMRLLSTEVGLYDRINEVWYEGTFEEYREALKEYVKTGLDAAKGKKKKLKARAT